MCDHCSCRTFEPIADLSAEHETILELAWEIASGARTDTEAVTALLAILDPHVAKEELGLYPRLHDAGDLDGDARTVLEEEHRELRSRLTSGTFDRRDYFELAAHIEAEEMELFPAAMFAFEDDTWAALEALVAAN